MISILICGKIGTGKSSLVNGLLGQKVAKEGGVAAGATTVTTKKYEDTFCATVQGKEVKISLWDTPGLGNPFDDDDSVTTKVARQAKDVDIIFYCLDMRHRLEKSDMEELERFSREAGPDIWKRMIFTLTYANQVAPTNSAEDAQKHFRKIVIAWNKALLAAMVNMLKIDEKTAKEVPIIPTGYETMSFPDRREWQSPVMITTFEKMRVKGRTTLPAKGSHVTYSNGKIRIDLDAQFLTYTADSEVNQDPPVRMSSKYVVTLVGAIVGAVLGASILGGPIGVLFGFVSGAIAGYAGRNFITLLVNTFLNRNSN